MDVTFVGNRAAALSDPELFEAHLRRLELINRPFPAIGGVTHTIPSYPWAGTIVGDQLGLYTGTADRRRRPADDVDPHGLDYETD